MPAPTRSTPVARAIGGDTRRRPRPHGRPPQQNPRRPRRRTRADWSRLVGIGFAGSLTVAVFAFLTAGRTPPTGVLAANTTLVAGTTASTALPVPAGRPARAVAGQQNVRPAGQQVAPQPALLLGAVLVVALLNIPLKNPVISAVRNPESPARVAVMERMRAQIPPEAKVAATSFLAPHLLPRLEIYYIPGGKMHHQPDEADYAFVDARAAGLRAEAARGNDILGRLLADPAWELVEQEDELFLLRKRAP